jgi:hypothetical protein
MTRRNISAADADDSASARIGLRRSGAIHIIYWRQISAPSASSTLGRPHDAQMLLRNIVSQETEFSSSFTA